MPEARQRLAPQQPSTSMSLLGPSYTRSVSCVLTAMVVPGGSVSGSFNIAMTAGSSALRSAHRAE